MVIGIQHVQRLILGKESLHSNAQQFLQFQENEQLPLISIIAQEKTANYDRHKNPAGLSRVIVPSPPSSIY
jgi:hypothetical protein